MRIRNKEEFVLQANKLHQNKFDYSKVEYVKSIEKVILVCQFGHEFLQSPNAHMQGHGCSVCHKASIGKWNQKSLSDFIIRATDKHGSKYNYSKVDYKKENINVIIICSCGCEFKQTPNNHYSGKGCPDCARNAIRLSRLSDKDQWLPKVKNVHGDSYDYTNVIYVNNSTKVSILCKSCDKVFEQSPNNHLSGNGCPTCAKYGYRVGKSAFLYVLSCGDMTKVGITSDLDRRLKQISRSFGSEFTIEYSWYCQNGSIPLTLESKILKELRSKYTQPVSKFDGCRECFFIIDRVALIKDIKIKIANLERA